VQCLANFWTVTLKCQNSISNHLLLQLLLLLLLVVVVVVVVLLLLLLLLLLLEKFSVQQVPHHTYRLQFMQCIMCVF
jgi:hypothetical protein